MPIFSPLPRLEKTFSVWSLMNVLPWWDVFFEVADKKFADFNLHPVQLAGADQQDISSHLTAQNSKIHTLSAKPRHSFK